MRHIMTAILFCMGLSAYGASEPSPLYAGTAKVDITPDQAVVSAHGESFRLPDELPEHKTPPNVLDPLYARVVVLKNKDVSVAIVTADLILFSSKRIVDEAKKQWGLDHVVMSATHTHEGMVPRNLCPTDEDWKWSFAPEDPGVYLDWPGFTEDPWWAETEEKVIAAIGEAAANMFPARIVAGKGHYDSEYLGHNRRLVRSDGRVVMLWDNPNRIPTEPRDPTVGVIRIEDKAGKPRVFMVHYACHPCSTMGGPRITADFPGAMCDYIEEELGPDCMAMFIQGAEGDIDSYEYKLRGDYGAEYIKQSGVTLGSAAFDVAKDLLSPEKPEASIDVDEQMLTIPYRTGDKTSDICITTVVIDKQLALVTIPGEIFVQHQLNLTERSPIPNTFIMGISYCGKGSPYIIYIPTAQAVKEGGYGATRCSYVSADAGDRMIDAAVGAIKRMTER